MKTWSWRRHRQPCPPDPFLDAIERIADREQVAIPPVGVSASPDTAPAAKAAVEIVASAKLLDEPPEIQEWHGAHEIGSGRPW